MKLNILVQRVNVGGQPIQGPLEEINNIGDLINKILPVLISLAALILFLVLIWGGYDFLLSRGNPEKIKSGKAKITTGLIGFGLLIFSYVAVRLVSQIFGLGGGLF